MPATSVRSSGVAKEPSASRMQWRGKKTAFLRAHLQEGQVDWGDLTYRSPEFTTTALPIHPPKLKNQRVQNFHDAVLMARVK